MTWRRFVMAAVSAGLMAVPAGAAPDPEALAGDWVLHIFIGDRQFDDRVHLEQDGQGRYGGTLTVPGRWSARIERVETGPGTVRFEIHAPEGKTPFLVRYEGRFYPGEAVFTGFATLPETHELLGGFVAQRAAKAKP